MITSPERLATTPQAKLAEIARTVYDEARANPAFFRDERAQLEGHDPTLYHYIHRTFSELMTSGRREIAEPMLIGFYYAYRVVRTFAEQEGRELPVIGPDIPYAQLIVSQRASPTPVSLDTALPISEFRSRYEDNPALIEAIHGIASDHARIFACVVFNSFRDDLLSPAPALPS